MRPLKTLQKLYDEESQIVITEKGSPPAGRSSPARTSSSRTCPWAPGSSSRGRRWPACPTSRPPSAGRINHPEGMEPAARPAAPGHEGHHRDRRHLAAAAADGARPTCARPCSRSCWSCCADSRRGRRPHDHRQRAAPPHDRGARCGAWWARRSSTPSARTATTTTTPRTRTAWWSWSARRTARWWRVNRRAAESDLLIYVNINFVPMDGGHKSVGTGADELRSASGRTTTRRRSATPTATWSRAAARSTGASSASAGSSTSTSRSSTSRRRSTTACSTARRGLPRTRRRRTTPRATG